MSHLSQAARWRSNPFPQPQSSYFTRLPREIRDLIYHNVLRADTQPVHLFLFFDRSRNYQSNIGAKPKRNGGGFTPELLTKLLKSTNQNQEHHHDDLTYAWMLSCKTMFSESYPLLFFIPAISIHDICTFDSWWITRPAHQLNKIHSLELELATLCNPALSQPQSGNRRSSGQHTWLDNGRWTTLWDTVATMRGLKILRVKLTRLPGAKFSIEMNRSILEPFLDMRGLQEFTVSLMWHVPELLMKEYIGQAPFKLSCTS